MNGEKIIDAKNITVRFCSKSGKIVTAVNDVSFSLEKGGTLAVVGESGSGKTTLLRSLIGLAPLYGGSVRLFGRELTAMTKSELLAARRRCGWVPQDPYGAIPPGLSAIEAVCEPDVVAGTPGTKKESRARAEDLLSKFGLKGERVLNSRAAALSGGQRQRVELARAMMLSPELLLADEPVSMQDASTRGGVVKILKELAERGIAMIFVTHDLLLAVNTAKHIIVMKDGAVCEAGLSQAVLSSPSHPYTRSLLEVIPVIKNNKARGASVVKR